MPEFIKNTEATTKATKPVFIKSAEAATEKIQPWKAHWPQSTMSSAHLDPNKFARAAGSSKGASPNQDIFVDGTKVYRLDDMERFIGDLKKWV
ncbi:hypothetical protein N7454_001128 [Penicillium verhagenii]|nr:hypothetical protein N7454_001128 [Penicillium verhagenii]